MYEEYEKKSTIDDPEYEEWLFGVLRAITDMFGGLQEVSYIWVEGIDFTMEYCPLPDGLCHYEIEPYPRSPDEEYELIGPIICSFCQSVVVPRCPFCGYQLTLVIGESYDETARAWGCLCVRCGGVFDSREDQRCRECGFVFTS